MTSSSGRPRRAVLGSLVASTVLAAAALTVTGAAGASAGSRAAATAASPYAAGSVRYVIGKPMCAPATPGHATCYAMRRVYVTKSTPGARAVVIGDGLTANDTIGPAGGLTPADLVTAYRLPTTSGSSQTVAIVDAYNDPTIEADLGVFDSQYGLPACTVANGCLSIVNQDGSTSPLPSNDTSGWSGEIALDVETVHGICTACKIVLVEADSTSDHDLGTATNTAATTIGANEVSNSYGEPESQALSGSAAPYNHPGVVIVASSGDDGYYSFDQLSGTNEPNVPAALNTVVAVGGTSLTLDQTGQRRYETVWNDNGPAGYYLSNFGAFGAGGGGCSNVHSAPKWQYSLSTWASTACGTNRLVADVSADADYLSGLDVYSSYECGGSCSTGWGTVGGTSLSAPLISAVFALAGGSHGVNYPALSLYGHLGSAGLNDVTIGGNGACDGQGAAQCGNPNSLGYGILDCVYPATGSTPAAGDRACNAQAGFDGPTGVGTPKGIAAFKPTGPKVKIHLPSLVTHGHSASFSATATDPFPGGTVKSYSFSWGDGNMSSSSSGSASHTYKAAGTFKLKVTATDSYGQKGSATVSVKVS
jgi:subtilase family serine protease